MKAAIQVGEETRQLITENVQNFFNWLNSLNLKPLVSQPTISFEYITTDDTLKVTPDNKLHFNLDYLNKCSELNFLTIILHEAYHVYINNIPNKRDATRVKDLYQNQMMLHIDIEADYYVAKFFKEKHSYDFNKYLSVYFQGATAFKDSEIRPLKFERFVCSMLTMCHLFKYNSMSIYRLSSESVRLYRLEKPIAIIHKGTHSETKLLNLNIDDLYQMQELYHEPDKYSEQGYCEHLSLILDKAINEIDSIKPIVTFE